jgi:hypothetical protein
VVGETQLNSSSDFWNRKYAYAALIAFVGLASVLDGVSEGVYLIAAGVIVVILVRAITAETRT